MLLSNTPAIKGSMPLVCKRNLAARNCWQICLFTNTFADEWL